MSDAEESESEKTIRATWIFCNDVKKGDIGIYQNVKMK